MSSFRIAVCLDITGSMGNQLTAAKSMLSGLVHKVKTNYSKFSIEIAVIPYTESSQKPGCFASLHVFKDLTEASEFIKTVKLCIPPTHPSVSASGEDGPENLKAALHLLTELDASVPTIAFVVTDALPHLRWTGASATAKHELNFLAGKGVSNDIARDAVKVFANVCDHFDGMLIVNPVIYGMAGDTFYGFLAKSTGGMYMSPNTTNASVTTAGLLLVVESVLSRLSGAALSPQTITGFSLYDLEDFAEEVEDEDQLAGIEKPKVGDAKTIFGSAMERAVDCVQGKRWKKRAMGMTSAVDQMKLVWRAAKYLITPKADRKESDFAELVANLEFILEALPADQKGHISLKVSDLEKQVLRGGADEDAVESIISLESVGDALSEDANEDDWLASVMGLLMGFPMKIQLPLDMLGNPDFMDAWAAVVQRLGVDQMTAADFATLIKKSDAGDVLGPTDNFRYNAFLALAPRKDPLASMVFWLMSGTQLLNCIQGVTMGAKGFIPNLYAGTASACLTKTIMNGKTWSSHEWNKMRDMVHSLRVLHNTPARDTTLRLKAGDANPADSPSKFVCALVRMDAPARATAMKVVMEEWLAYNIQRIFGKANGANEESDKKYLDLVASLLPLDAIVEGGIAVDPMKAFHVLELDKVSDEMLKSEWKDAAIAKLRTIRMYETFVKDIRTLHRILLDAEHPPGDDEEEKDPEEVIGELWPEWEEGFLRLLLLRARRDRYTAHHDKETDVVTFSKNKSIPMVDLAIKRLREVHKDALASYARERREAMKTAAVKMVVEKVRAHPFASDDTERMTEMLATLYVDLTHHDVQDENPALKKRRAVRPETAPKGPTAGLLGLTLTLGRMEVPVLLAKFKKVQKREQAARALIFGAWTTAPPQALRRSTAQLMDMVKDEDLKLQIQSELKQGMLCARPVGFNRHGHSLSLNYPGACGWTQPYEEQRVCNKPGKLGYVKQMKKFTDFSKWAETETETAREARVKVWEIITKYDDANTLPLVQKKIEALLGTYAPRLFGSDEFPPLK